MSQLEFRSLIVAATSVALLATASADDFWKPRPSKAELEAQKELREEYNQWLGVGDKHAVEAGHYEYDPRMRYVDQTTRFRRQRSAVSKSIQAYKKAIALRPDDAEAYYRVAEVIFKYRLDSDRNTPVMRDRSLAIYALDCWSTFERMAPLDPRVRETLFERAIVHTKMATEEHYEQALPLYEAILRRSDLASEHPQSISVWMGNMAETYMMVGRLEQSISAYRRALEALDRHNTAYGLAVALDRDEQGEEARELLRGWGLRGVLKMKSDPSVFYVPRGERDYYIALGYDAIGHWGEAAAYYQSFIDSGAHPRYQARARENLAWVQKKLRAQRKSNKRLPRLPRGLGL